jgi:hypothetical protein
MSRNLLSTGLSLVVVLGAILAVAAFLWPGLLRTPPAPPAAPVGITDPMALVPADSNWLLGADLEQARKQGVLDPIVSFLAHPPAALPDDLLPPGLAEVLRNGESLLVAGKMGTDDVDRPVVIVTLKSASDVETVKAVCNAGATTPMHGHTAYHTDLGEKGTQAWLAFPGERLVVLSTRREPEFARLLDPTKHQQHPAHALIQEAQQAPVWAVLCVDDRLLDALKGVGTDEFAPLLGSLKAARGAIVKLAFPEKPPAIDGTLAVVCTSEADAAKVADQGQQAWATTKQTRLQAQAGLAFLNPVLAGLMGDLNRSMQINADGARVAARVQVTTKTLQQLQKMAPN